MSLKNVLSIALVAITAGASLAVISGSPAAAADVECVTTLSVSGTGGTSLFAPTSAIGNPACSLYSGDANDGVRGLQEAMNTCYGKSVLGKYYPLSQDGIFGPNTKAALKLVQSKVGASPDGGYGPETRSKMKFPARTGGCYNIVF